MKQLRWCPVLLVIIFFLVWVVSFKGIVRAAGPEETPLPEVFSDEKVVVECGVGFAQWKNWRTTSVTYTFGEGITVFADVAVNGSAIALLVVSADNVQMADIDLLPENQQEINLFLWTSEVTAITFPFRRCGENLYFGEAYLFETEVSASPTATPSP